MIIFFIFFFLDYLMLVDNGQSERNGFIASKMLQQLYFVLQCLNMIKYYMKMKQRWINFIKNSYKKGIKLEIIRKKKGGKLIILQTFSRKRNNNATGIHSINKFFN